ncbi:O-antigen ligase family protein [Vreelandella aquamarina]
MNALNPAAQRTFVSTTTTNTAVFLLTALALVVPSGYSLGALILMLAGLGLMLRRGLPVFSRQDGAVIGVLLAYAIVSITRALWDGQGSRGLDEPLRFIFAIPALYWVMRYPPSQAFLWSGLAMGAAAAGSWASWQKLVEGVDRATGYTHVIQFGNLSMLMGVLCLAGLGWAAVAPRYRRVWVAVLLLGAIGGVLGSLFSGSRGGWIGLPLVLLVLYRGYGRHLTVRLKAAAGVLILLGAGTVYGVPQLGVQERVHQAVSDVQLYISGENRATSVGARFDMWRGAALLIAEKPLTGWGSNGYAEAMSELGENGVIGSYAAQFEHAHNEFIDALAKRGLPGLVALLALYLVPMRLFYQGFDGPIHQRAVAVAGVLLPVTYIDFGLSQSFLTHNSGIMMYAFLLVVLWGYFSHHAKPTS